MRVQREILPSRLPNVGFKSTSPTSRPFIYAAVTDLILFSILTYIYGFNIQPANRELDFTSISDAKRDILSFCERNKLTCSTTSLFILLGAIRSAIIAIKSARRIFSLIGALNGVIYAFFFQTTVPLFFLFLAAFPLWHSVSNNEWPYRLFSPSMWLGKLNEIAMFFGTNDFTKFTADVANLHQRNYWTFSLVCLFLVVGLMQRRVLRVVSKFIALGIRVGMYWFNLVKYLFRRVLLRRVAVHFIPLALFTIASIHEFYVNDATTAMEMAHERSTALSILAAALIGYWWMRYWLQSAPADSRVFVDDITRLNKTAVDRVFYVKTADDLKNIIAMAHINGKQVSIRGQSHTMGGQTIASDGYVIDMKYFNNISYDPATQTVKAEPGATWGQLIKYLNDFGMSPSIMQSYCSFSVGGTIAVNAHGITSDYGMYESVVSLELIDSSGQRLTCSRTQNRELFSLVIGGYGLFGFICEVTMKVVPNVKISMESIKLESEEFPTYYQRVLEDPSVEVKLARIDITRPQDIFLFIFRKDSDQRTVSDLDSEARVMKQTTQFLYKWAMPLRVIQRLRYFVETYASKPLDWSGENDRNLLMYESAAPLARLYTGIVSLDHTFVLQEFFIPHDNFGKWMKAIRLLLKKPFEHVTLLNITIRYLYKDDNSFLPYATTDMFAFVFYYRLRRTTTADDNLEHIHNRFVEIALSLGGTFYLPYRHHYSDQQLRQAYPRIETFFKRKSHYDPKNVFSNLWYKRYANTVVDVHKRPSATQPNKHNKALLEPNFDSSIVPIVSEHRTNSYQEVFKSQVLKKKLEVFLRIIFNIENPDRLFSQIALVVWNPKNNTDMKVYNEIQRRLNARKFQSYFKLRNGIKTLKQVSEQRTELAQETLSIATKLGLVGSLHDYASIGDSGKMILSLRAALGMKGNAYVIHDRQRTTDIVERGSLFQVGNFVPIDYHHIEDIPIPSSSVDLVTMNQGLHHLHQNQIVSFLKIVYRILRPGGIFLVREHDARPELIPILDLAHSIFNAVTGVSSDDEKHEIRAFRPMSEWRRIMTEVGFEDMYLYEMQHNDPTEDYMLCFAKPPFKTQRAQDVPLTLSQEIIAEADHRIKNTRVTSVQEDSTTSYYRLPEWVLVRVTQMYANFLNHTPWYRFPYVKFTLLYWKLVLFAFLNAARFRDPLRAAINIGLIMDVIIGFVLTLLFAQLWVLAIPLRLLYGGENPSEGESEQLLVTVPSHSNVDWPRIDHRIQWQSLGVKNNSALFLLTIPKHIPFTEILMKIANTVEGIQLIEISGQRDDMQIEVTTDQKSAINPLKRLAGARYLYDYQYPTDPATTYLAFSVKINQLFAVLTELQAHNHVHVLQIYDFLPVSSALLKALRMEEPDNPIDVKRAQEQHKSYTDTLKQLLPHVFELPEEPDLADSNFVEDTAVVIDDTALIPIMGALERRPETAKIKETLRQCGKHIVEMHEPGTLDGGDVLFTGHHIFVGLSRRTNQSGVDQLAAAFSKYKVHAIPVSAGLHLKSVMSCFDDKTILIADTEYGRKAAAAIEHAVGHGTYEIVFVHDVAASNILRIKNSVVVQDHLPKSIGVINQLAEAKQVHVKLTDSSELWKVDGLLTCCSILFKVK